MFKGIKSAYEYKDTDNRKEYQIILNTLAQIISDIEAIEGSAVERIDINSIGEIEISLSKIVVMDISQAI